MAGFDVVITDDRETYANRERFPDARDIYAEEYEQVVASLLQTIRLTSSSSLVAIAMICVCSAGRLKRLRAISA